MRLQLIDPESARGTDVEPIFTEIAEVFGGRVPNLFRAYARHPGLLRGNWEKTKALMVEEGGLPRRVKEAIALSVSHDNGCAYCVAAHGGALRALGLGDEQLQALQGDLDNDGFEASERLLIRFARHVNRDPLNIPDTAIAALREAGWEEGQWVEAIGVVELFSGFNKFLDSMQIEIDF